MKEQTTLITKMKLFAFVTVISIGLLSFTPMFDYVGLNVTTVSASASALRTSACESFGARFDSMEM